MMEKKELRSEIFKSGTQRHSFARQKQNTVFRRKQIIGTLRRIIIKYGSEHVTIRKLAKEIGLSDGALYRHFKSKREILLFLVDDIEDNLNGDFERAYSIKNPLGLLERKARDLLSSNEQRKGVIFLVIAEIISLGDKGLNQKVSEVLNSFLDYTKQLILEGIKAGKIREDVDVDMAATAFFGMLQGLVTIWSLSGFPSTLEIKNESMWKFFFEAIRKEDDKSLAGSMAKGLSFSTAIGSSKPFQSEIKSGPNIEHPISPSLD
jgi:AcrR family transcriptional regulator